MPPKCTALLQCKLHNMLYVIIKCHGAISSDVIQESAADISPQPSLLARDTVDLCFEP